MDTFVWNTHSETNASTNILYIGLTSVAHFPALEVEYCEIVGMDRQIQLHGQNGLAVHFPRTKEVHSENYEKYTNRLIINN